MHTGIDTLLDTGSWLAQFVKDTGFLIPAELRTDSGIYYVSPGEMISRVSEIGNYSSDSRSRMLLYTPVLDGTEWTNGRSTLFDIRSGESTELPIRMCGPRPAWSKDASRFAFVGYIDETADRCVSVYDVYRNSVRTCIDNDAHYLTWNRDEELVTMLYYPNGEEVRLVRLEGIAGADIETLLRLDFKGSLWGLELSADDSRVCYFQFADDEYRDAEMCILNLMDRSSFTIRGINSEVVPVWSQDGSKLVYASFDSDGQSILEVHAIRPQERLGSFIINRADETGEVPISRPFFLGGSRYLVFLDFELEGDAIVVADTDMMQIKRLRTDVRLGAISLMSGISNWA